MTHQEGIAYGLWLQHGETTCREGVVPKWYELDEETRKEWLKQAELVLCVQSSHLRKLFGSEYGVHTDCNDEHVRVISRYCAPYWRTRWATEDDPSYKQLIPYVILRCGIHYAVYQRGGGGGEERLHGMLSLGLGGHINRPDMACDSIHLACLRAAEREVREEVIFADENFCRRRRTLGILCIAASAVSSVHCGVPMFWDMQNTRVYPREIQKIGKIAWHTRRELLHSNMWDRLEPWSKEIVINFLE